MNMSDITESKYFVGIDLGSTMCKAVLFLENNLVDKEIVKTGYNHVASARDVFSTLLKRNNVDEKNIIVSSTGYGRELIDFASKSYTEITCHSLGALHLDSSIQAVIDIGGQDMKAIKIEDGKAQNFIMNDKCAAGTGRFLAMALEKLEIQFEDIDKHVEIESSIKINNTCAVFAESEIISLIAQNKNRYDIMSGVIHSIALKVSQMISKFELSKDKNILLTGGLYASDIIRQIIENTIKYRVITSKYSQFAGSIGAAILTYNNHIKK